MIVYEYEDYSVPGFVDSMMTNQQDYGICRVTVTNNTQVEMPVRMFLLNVIFWEPLMEFDIRPTVKEVYKISHLTNTAISKIHTQLYEIFLEQRPNLSHMDFVTSLFNNIGRLYNFVKLHCGKHLPPIDALGLTKLMDNEPLKKLASVYLDPKLGTKVAEVTMKGISKELIDLLGDAELDENVLYPYIKAGILKSNQIPQMLVAYGTRSDIDDTMRKHIISNSAFSGLDSIKDYATEYLSAKKSIYANSSAIKRSQYHGRKLKLALSTLPRLYPGSCGSERTLEFRIRDDFKHNFIEKIIVDNGEYKILTKDNINEYVEKPVKLVSPFCCNYTDGVCERCAGYGRGRLIKYTPPSIHIGLLAATRLASIISQKILSTKHLITTFSTLLTLDTDASKIFCVIEDTIMFKPKYRTSLRNISIRVPMDAISMVEDIHLEMLPIAENFSKLSFIEIISKGVVKQSLPLGSGTFLPYLSEYTLKYMKDYPDCLNIEADYVDIDMKHFDIKQPFCKYIIMNDAVLAYHSRVSSFLSTGIRNHTTVVGALNEFAITVYDKSSLDFFFLEMVLRAFNVCEHTNYKIPVIEDMNNTNFDGMAQTITNSTLSMKLSFERLGDYLSTPAAVIIPRPAGMYAPFYGLK